MRPLPHLLAFFGHHKCASTWVHSILAPVCAEAGWRLAYLYDEGSFGNDLAAHVAAQRIDVLSYVNADARFLQGLPPFRGFHVVRDPRDLVVSAYFSHRNSHPTRDWPELIEHRARLQALGKDEGLLLEMEFDRPYLEEMLRWDYGQPHVLELRMEDLTPDPYRQFLRIFGFLGILDESHQRKGQQLGFVFDSALNILHHQHKWPWPRRRASFPAGRLLDMVHDNRFSNFAGGREAGQVDEASHYRKGVAGDWRNHFGDRHAARFQELYGEVLLKLGYEASADWAAATARRST